jgi:hypothetical protein
MEAQGQLGRRPEHGWHATAERLVSDFKRVAGHHKWSKPLAYTAVSAFLFIIWAGLKPIVHMVQVLWVAPGSSCDWRLKDFLVSIRLQNYADALCGKGYTMLEDLLHMSGAQCAPPPGL